jgi:hypothetical protein
MAWAHTANISWIFQLVLDAVFEGDGDVWFDKTEPRPVPLEFYNEGSSKPIPTHRQIPAPWIQLLDSNRPPTLPPYNPYGWLPDDQGSVDSYDSSIVDAKLSQLIIEEAIKLRNYHGPLDELPDDITQAVFELDEDSSGILSVEASGNPLWTDNLPDPMELSQRIQDIISVLEVDTDVDIAAKKVGDTEKGTAGNTRDSEIGPFPDPDLNLSLSLTGPSALAPVPGPEPGTAPDLTLPALTVHVPVPVPVQRTRPISESSALWKNRLSLKNADSEEEEEVQEQSRIWGLTLKVRLFGVFFLRLRLL